MIWRRWTFWSGLLVATTLIGLLEAAQLYTGMAALNSLYPLPGAPNQPVRWSVAMSTTMPSWYLIVALLPGIIFLAQRFPLEAGRWRFSLSVHLLAAIGFAIVHILGSSFIGDALAIRLGVFDLATIPAEVRLARLFMMYFVVELLTYFALVVTHHAYMSNRRYRERERVAAQLELSTSRLEGSLVRANLEALRAQLNPHFLFNTLNAVSVLALKGERQKVVRILMLLSELLRMSLTQKRQLVPLREELLLLDRYLEIEQVRFRDRLALEREIAPDTLDAAVPSLLLQPLVENAIRHGIAQRVGPGTVRVEARIRAHDVLELRVLDTGPGFGTWNGQGGTGLGITNTQARLEQLFGEAQSLELSNRQEGGACVTVRMPRQVLTDGSKDELQTLRTGTL